MDNNLTSIISSANSILVLLPNKPYFDQVAAGLSLYLSLKDSKDVSISCPSAMVVEFNRLIGINKISSELGNKNLTISFPGYPAENIERVSADVEGTDFKLTVISKSGFTSPKKEQVNLGFSGVAADLVILIGGANDSHFSALSTPVLANSKIVHIGIRPLSSEKNILSFSSPASSVSELIAYIIKEGNYQLDSDTATNLIAGIEDGSNKFTGSDVTANTFDAVANLLRSGGQRIPKGIPQNKFPVGSIPGQDLKVKTIEKKEQPVKTIQTEEAQEPAPKDWFEPKIYKGTSVS